MGSIVRGYKNMETKQYPELPKLHLGFIPNRILDYPEIPFGVQTERLGNLDLDIMPEIKFISGDKSGQKIYREFLKTDRRNRYQDCETYLRTGFIFGKHRFQLKIPKRQFWGNDFCCGKPMIMDYDKGSRKQTLMCLTCGMTFNKPLGLNPEQEYILQNIFLKWKAVGNEVLNKKDRKLPIIYEDGKRLHYSRLITLDFRKSLRK
jgi:hypothetical protein